jgi:glycogen debranching enzyme
MNQLPELYSGLQRVEGGFPVQYVGANVPQAWAAGSVFALLQAILGITVDAPRGRIFVDPTLPTWLPDVTLSDVRLERRSFDIRFWRDDKGTTQFEVLRGHAHEVERRPFRPIGPPQT